MSILTVWTDLQNKSTRLLWVARKAYQLTGDQAIHHVDPIHRPTAPEIATNYESSENGKNRDPETFIIASAIGHWSMNLDRDMYFEEAMNGESFFYEVWHVGDGILASLPLDGKVTL